MKKFQTLLCSSLIALPVLSGAHEAHHHSAHYETHHHSAPDAQGPIGVMADHPHRAGEWMLSYRYMQMSMESLRAGTDGISNQEAFHRGYSLVPTSMDMSMHMFGVMVAPSDRVTLMAMTHYVSKEMDMVSDPMAAMTSHGHGHHGTAMAHHHDTEGLGDTVLTALIPITTNGPVTVHIGLGVGLPTAEVEEKMGDVYQPYGMQLGNGVWDFRPSVTARGALPVGSWGAQAAGRFNLEDENDAGFAYGDEVTATVWGGVPLLDWLSASLRLAYRHQDAIEGHYNGPHNHSAPPNFQENYGGDTVHIGIGANAVVPSGFLQDHRFAVEVLTPVYQDLNGIQLEQELTVVAGWQKSW